MPPVETDKRALGVVIGQGPGHDHKEIPNSARSQRRPNGAVRFPLAERPVPHMRMDHRFVRGRRMRVQREYLVTSRAFLQAFIVQDDLKTSEVNAVQLNGLGDDRELMLFEADLDLRELISQADDVFINVS